MEQDKYYSANEVDRFGFLRIPRVFFSDAQYTGLSLGAKLLYGLMLDRMGLSPRNGWVDEDSCAYIIFAEESAAKLLNSSIPTVCKLMKELEEAALIRRKRRGQGKPTLIYVLRFSR